LLIAAEVRLGNLDRGNETNRHIVASSTLLLLVLAHLLSCSVLGIKVALNLDGVADMANAQVYDAHDSNAKPGGDNP